MGQLQRRLPVAPLKAICNGEETRLQIQMIVTDTLDLACSNMAFFGDSLYYYATEWNNYTASNSISYGIIDIKTKK